MITIESSRPSKEVILDTSQRFDFTYKSDERFLKSTQENFIVEMQIEDVENNLKQELLILKSLLESV